MSGFGLCGLSLVTAGLLAANAGLPDFSMRTSSGPVLFHDVKLSGGSLRVSGVATNQGARKWSGLLADLELVDPLGNPVGRAPIMFRDMDRGDSKRFEETVQLFDPRHKEFSGYRVVYHTGALKVQYVLTMVKPERNRLLEFSDPLFDFSFSISESSIEMKLKNNFRAPVMVVWSKAEFSDVFEQIHLVTHFGAGDSEIEPATTRSETIEPVGGNAAGLPGEYEGWRAMKVLPPTQDAGEIPGRSISLSVPMDVDGVRRTYLFVFRVEGMLI